MLTIIMQNLVSTCKTRFSNFRDLDDLVRHAAIVVHVHGTKHIALSTWAKHGRRMRCDDSTKHVESKVRA